MSEVDLGSLNGESSACTSDGSGSDVFSNSNNITAKEYFQACCKASYRVRRLKIKGAILIVIWSFLVMCTYHYTSMTITNKNNDSICNIIVTVTGVMLPLAGWLADVRFGRYKVIHISIWIMWMSSMLLTVVDVIFDIVKSYDDSYVHQIISVVLTIFLSIGYGGFQANIIQFGVDQLIDASTIEITSFVVWYTWTMCGSKLTMCGIRLLTCVDSKYFTIGPLVICTSLTLLVSSNCLFSNQLIKEPVTQNPFSLIYRVICYAVKHNRPQYRSAFTYWEDEPPLRIDFGKRKYGGPFTTEQVEDVKIFFKILGLLLVASIPMGITYNFSKFGNSLSHIYFGKFSNDNMASPNRCFHNDFFDNIFAVFEFIIIPLNEVILYPVCYRFFTIKSQWKTFLGIFLKIGGYMTLIILITYARVSFADTSESSSTGNNSTIHCLFQENSDPLNSVIDYRWLILVSFLFSLSDVLLTIGIIEFYCSQVPYSVKGLVAGCYYSALGLVILFNSGITQAFKEKTFSSVIFGCEFWYLQTKLILMLVVIFLLVVAIKCCSVKRIREDVLPNEHIFAEQYYSRVTDSD